MQRPNVNVEPEVLCSVVCITFNHVKYSQAAIESIVAQSYRPIEVIVLDDGSSDGNAEVIRKALIHSGVPHIIIEQENTGNVAQNVNRALRKARGDIVVFMSLDDLLLPNCISGKMALMHENDAVSLVVNGYHAELDQSGRVISVQQPLPILGHVGCSASDLKELEYQSIGTFFLQGSAFRRRLLLAVGGFDEDIPGDDLVFRTKIWDYLVAHSDEAMCVQKVSGFAYRIHGSGLHKDVRRQVLTVIAWRDRFFPDKPIPAVAKVWLSRLMTQLEELGDPNALNECLSAHPLLKEEYQWYVRSLTRLRRVSKRKLSTFLSSAMSKIGRN